MRAEPTATRLRPGSNNKWNDPITFIKKNSIKFSTANLCRLSKKWEWKMYEKEGKWRIKDFNGEEHMYPTV